MYSYIPEDALIKGLRLGELFYANLDNDLKLKEIYVDAALKHSKKNLYHIPMEYFEEKQNEKGFNLDAFVSSVKDAPAMSLFALYENPVEIKGVKKLIFDKSLCAKLIATASENAEGSVLSVMSMNHPMLNDVDFFKEVITILKKTHKFNNEGVLEFIKKALVRCGRGSRDTFTKDIDVCKHIIRGIEYASDINFLHNDVLSNPVAMLILLNDCLKDFSNEQKKYLSNFSWHKNLLADKDFIVYMAKLEAVKNVIDIENVFYSDMFSEKMLKNHDFIYSVLKDLIDSGYILNNFEWSPVPYEKMNRFIKDNEEYAKFLFNNIPAFFLEYCEDPIAEFDPEEGNFGVNQKKIISLIDFEGVPQLVLNQWVVMLKKMGNNFFAVAEVKKNSLKAEKEILKSLFVGFQEKVNINSF